MQVKQNAAFVVSAAHIPSLENFISQCSAEANEVMSLDVDQFQMASFL